MGHVMGAEKGNFLIRDAEADEATGRPRQWNPVNPCPRGVPGVAQGRYYTRASAYTACAAASRELRDPGVEVTIAAGRG